MLRLSSPASEGLRQTQRSSSRPTTICWRCSKRLFGTQPSPFVKTSVRSHVRRQEQSTWSAAINAAQSLFNNANGGSNRGSKILGGVEIDPFKTVAKEMKFLTGNLRQLVGSGHPMLDTVAKYYTQAEGKHIRPMLVLLISRATASLSERSRKKLHQEQDQQHRKESDNINTTSSSSYIDTPFSSSSVLSELNPTFSTRGSTSTITASSSDVLPSQTRLAEITELIHTASLLHDDVLDTSTTRRGSPSANIAFGNKMAVLAGDFLLGRASVSLARLRNSEVTELLATVIANLIEGEFLQLRNTVHDEPRPQFENDSTIPYYLRKTYLKSASLISKSCRAAALLGECPIHVVDAAYLYGKNLGLAFQLVDDMLDFTAEDSTQLGKPAGADLDLGLATAPLLFAWKSHPELGELVGRKFSGKGDVSLAKKLVRASDGIEQTRALAQSFADQAENAIEDWPDCEAKGALSDMCARVMQRRN